jgi:hypothetical protein
MSIVTHLKPLRLTMMHPLGVISAALALCIAFTASLASAQAPIRIMALGDSITGSPVSIPFLASTDTNVPTRSSLPADRSL